MSEKNETLTDYGNIKELYNEKRDINNSDIADDIIINEYYKHRDACVDIDGKKCYPNIKELFATPFEREKDRRELKRILNDSEAKNEIQAWYEEAKNKSCLWWLENHVIAKHALHSCMSCGACTALCPAAELYEFTPRIIMETVAERNENSIIELLKSDDIWMCHQCGSCKTKCPRNNSPFGLISSLRQLAQIKGYHLHSIRGRQQYAGRHLWGGNLWNRGCSLYFRNPVPDKHRDLGERYKELYEHIDEHFIQVGADPDMEGSLSGRKINPATLDELRKLWIEGGAVFFWDIIEEHAKKQADDWDMSIEEYHDKVGSEG
jgi:heterodisulfide reductase subunit C1